MTSPPNQGLIKIRTAVGASDELGRTAGRLNVGETTVTPTPPPSSAPHGAGERDKLGEAAPARRHRGGTDMRSWPGHRSCWPGTATRPPAAASSFLNAAGRLGG